MLVKLSKGENFNTILRVAFLYESVLGAFIFLQLGL